jgi:hypothetical protein
MSGDREYDPRADAVGSYYAAVEAKRLRGDTHWPAPRERVADPQTEREMKRLKRALDRKLREAEGGGDA